jgi:hypothetical protein
VRLVDFLIFLLEAHAHALHRLAMLFGDEILVQMLEESGDAMALKMAPPKFKLEWFEGAAPDAGYSSPYSELEAAVSGFKLPAPLEFHLWAYPFYRMMVESGLELDQRIPGPGGDVGVELVDEAVDQAEAWIRALPIAPEFALQAQRAAHMPWLRFRTQALKRIGKRPLGPVY